VVNGIEVRGSASIVSGATTLKQVLDNLASAVADDGYLAIQAYVDRHANRSMAGLRDAFAARVGRPVTFGWGPRFLHSTGQFHKGGPKVGAFLQLLSPADADLDIPDRPFTFGQLIQAQAAGDASVLEDLGRPVLSLTLANPADGEAAIRSALG
jgi:glucose-6-phosphate isomerase